MNYISTMQSKTEFKLSYFLEGIGLPKSKYYSWKNRLGQENSHNGKIPKEHWHTPIEEKAVLSYARKHLNSTERYFRDGYRRLTYRMIDEDIAVLCPSSVYRKSMVYLILGIKREQLQKEKDLINQINHISIGMLI